LQVDQLRTALEEWQAGTGTVDQASRAFEIARLRYRQGISNQLEINDARVSLLEARANRARAARDVQVMRATIALLPLLPVSTVPHLPGQPTVPLRMQGQTTTGVFLQEASTLQTPQPGITAVAPQTANQPAGPAAGVGRRF
jgi:hypothetical protein